MNQPLISVVIPMYNVEKYITTAIHSVLLQSYPNFELICVDDGGKDQSVSKVLSISDPRIRIVRQKNGGLANARNTGLNEAKGEFIALLDADDLWAFDKLEKHVAHLLANSSIDISYCPSLFIDDDDNTLGIGQFPKIRKIRNQDILCRNPVGNGSAAVIRRSLLTKIAQHQSSKPEQRISYFDERLRQSEDIEFWLRCALGHDAKFEGIPEPLTYYRINQEGLSANLEKQLASWHLAMSYNRSKHPDFFKQWFDLALAYQYRYLARRAIQSSQPQQASQYIYKALKQAPGILVAEPKRTINTLICSLLLNLSRPLFEKIANGILATKRLLNSSPLA